MRRIPSIVTAAALAVLLLPAAAPAQALAQPELDDRLINLPTHKTVGYGTLEAVFTHRFSQTVDDGDFQNLYGLDSAADIGLGLTLGFAPRWEAGIYRSSFQKQWELGLKRSALRQGSSSPLGLGIRFGGGYRTADGIDDRATGFVQVTVSRRLGPALDLFLVPMYASDTPSLTNAVNVGAAAAIHLPRRWDVIVEAISPNGDADGARLAWAVGFNKRIRGHSFLIYLGNSRATTADLLAGSDIPGGFKASDVRLGFNLIRRFPE